MGVLGGVAVSAVSYEPGTTVEQIQARTQHASQLVFEEREFQRDAHFLSVQGYLTNKGCVFTHPPSRILPYAYA